MLRHGAIFHEIGDILGRTTESDKHIARMYHLSCIHAMRSFGAKTEYNDKTQAGCALRASLPAFFMIVLQHGTRMLVTLVVR